jgi:hypothetical protein
MKPSKRRFFTQTDKTLMWDRWQKGESLNSIARLLSTSHSAISGVLSKTGGVRPPERHRSRVALTLAERHQRLVERSSVTVAANPTGPTKPSKPPGIGRTGQRPVNWRRTVRWPSSLLRSCSCSGHHDRLPVG